MVFDVGPAVDASQQIICLPESGSRLRNLLHLLQDSNFNQQGPSVDARTGRRWIDR